MRHANLYADVYFSPASPAVGGSPRSCQRSRYTLRSVDLRTRNFSGWRRTVRKNELLKTLRCDRFHTVLFEEPGFLGQSLADHLVVT